MSFTLPAPWGGRPPVSPLQPGPPGDCICTCTSALRASLHRQHRLLAAQRPLRTQSCTTACVCAPSLHQGQRALTNSHQSYCCDAGGARRLLAGERCALHAEPAVGRPNADLQTSERGHRRRVHLVSRPRRPASCQAAADTANTPGLDAVHAEHPSDASGAESATVPEQVCKRSSCGTAVLCLNRGAERQVCGRCAALLRRNDPTLNLA